MASQLVEQAAMYYASIVLRAILDCFLLNHEIIADPRQKHPLDVIFLSETLPAQYAPIAIHSVIMVSIIV